MMEVEAPGNSCLRVIFSENRFPPRIKSGASFCGITR
jgi:hypothetical protein